MTLKTLSLLIIWMTVTSAVYASVNKKQILTTKFSAGMMDESNSTTDNTGSAKQLPPIPSAGHKVPQHKSSVPQMEELPHIHKFHKERVKKVKKHHSKLWVISQLILILCHISMLVIAFLHATH